MAVKDDNPALVIAITKANRHPDPEGFASFVSAFLSGKDPFAEEVVPEVVAEEPVAEEGQPNA